MSPVRRTSGRAERLAVVVLAVVVVAAVTVGCSSDGRELDDPVFPPPPTEPPPTVPVTVDVLPSEPSSDDLELSSFGSDGVVIDRLLSPENAVAEVSGTGADRDSVITVDGSPADVMSFDVDADGSFTARLRIVDEGAHTVCVDDSCSRVYTLAADARSPEEITADIEVALDEAAGILPYGDLFAEWTVEIAGALSGTGGSVDADRKVVSIYRNRGRTVDDFVRTVLHEFGHVVDIERLDDSDRAAYLEIAGYPPGTPWRAESVGPIDQWAEQPAEDFAEVLVGLWSNGRWLPRTRAGLDADVLAATAELAGFGDD